MGILSRRLMYGQSQSVGFCTIVKLIWLAIATIESLGRLAGNRKRSLSAAERILQIFHGSSTLYWFIARRDMLIVNIVWLHYSTSMFLGYSTRSPTSTHRKRNNLIFKATQLALILVTLETLQHSPPTDEILQGTDDCMRTGGGENNIVGEGVIWEEICRESIIKGPVYYLWKRWRVLSPTVIVPITVYTRQRGWHRDN